MCSFMENKHHHLKKSRILWSLFLYIFLVGCNHQRDLAQDPANSPLIVPLNVQYDQQRGATVIEWEYLGIEPPVQYKLTRTDRDGTLDFEWIDLPLPNREASIDTDVWDMAPILDMTIEAGEQYSYTMQTQTTLMKPSENHIGNVQIPGGRIDRVALDPTQGTNTIFWSHTLGTLQNQELFRQIDMNAPQLIFQTNTFENAQFTDRIFEGNKQYRYFIRSVFDDQTTLQSRAFIVLPYVQDGQHLFPITQNGYFHLASGEALGRLFAALITSDTEMVLSLQESGTDAPSRQRLSINNIPNRISPAMAITTSGFPRVPKILLATILSDSKRLDLRAFPFVSFSQDVLEEESWLYSDWPISNINDQAIISISPNGTIFVAVGNTLRAFTSDLIQIGQVELNLTNAVVGMTFSENGLWALVANSPRLFRSPNILDGQGQLHPPNWEQIDLSPNSQPIGIGYKNGIVFVVDAIEKRVWTFDTIGTPKMHWQIDDAFNFNHQYTRGGVVSLGQDDVFVWDAFGRVIRFRNFVADLENR